MVAYSFNKRFAPAIVDGLKTHTIRAERGPKGRHARPGEPVQLYVGMRTKYCQKLLEPDPICTSVKPILIIITKDAIHAVQIAEEETIQAPHRLEAFARTDGFPNLKSMHEFWVKEHGARNFNGVMIEWSYP